MSVEPNEKPEETTDESKKAVTGSLLGALGFMEGKEEPTEPATTEDPPKETPAEEPEPTEELKEETNGVVLSAKDIRVTRKEKEAPKQPEPVKEPEPEKKVVETPKEEPKEEPKVKLEGLAANERETIELLQFGEEKSIADKGTSDKLIDFYVRRAELKEKLASENEFEEDYEVSEDPRYKKWLRANKPPVDVSKMEEIRNEKLITTAEDRAYNRLKKEQEARDEKWNQVMKEQNLEKARPHIERTVSDFSDQLLAEMPEEVTANLKAGKKWEQVEEESPLEAPIVKSVLNEFSDRAEILVSMYEGVLDVDLRNPLQADLGRFIRAQAEAMTKLPPEKTQRSGKRFVRPQDDKGEDDTWTFSQDDVLTMLRKQAVNTANSRIEAEKKKLEAYMKKQGQPAPEQIGEARRSSSSPQVKPSASGTPGKTGGNKTKGLFDVLMG